MKFYCGIGIQTTGDSPFMNEVLEVACVVANEAFVEVASYSTVIQAGINNWNPHYVITHLNSGLLGEWFEFGKLGAQASKVLTLEQAQAGLVSLLNGVAKPEDELILTDCSPDTKIFLESSFQDVAALMTKQEFSVASVRNFLKLSFAESSLYQRPSKRNRALDDTREIFFEARHQLAILDRLFNKLG